MILGKGRSLVMYGVEIGEVIGRSESLVQQTTFAATAALAVTVVADKLVSFLPAFQWTPSVIP